MAIPQLKTRMFYGDYQFAPVPLLTWTTELVKSTQGDSLSLNNTLNLNGSLLELGGESGNFPGLLLQRQALIDGVTASGQKFSITHEGLSVVSGIYPTLATVDFEQAGVDAGTWSTEIPYTIVFNYSEAVADNTPIEGFSESWEFEENEDRVSFVARHNLSAVGQNTAVSGGNNSIDNARTFVLNKTGYNNVPLNHPAFVEGSGALLPYEELRTESVDVEQGSVSVTESFTLSSGNFVHTQNGNFTTDENGITTIQLDGNIRGLGRRTACFANAITAYSNNVEPFLAGVAQTIYDRYAGSGTLATSNPKSNSIAQAEFNGTIGYGRAYDDDPASDLPPEIESLSLAVAIDEPVQLFATIPIPDRSSGPVVQDVGTTTPGTYTINGTTQGKIGVSIATVSAFAQQKINENLPTIAGLSAQTLVLTRKVITTDEFNRTVAFNLVWQFTSAQAAADGPQLIPC